MAEYQTGSHRWKFDNFVDIEEDEDEKKDDSVRVDPVSSFSSEEQP